MKKPFSTLSVIQTFLPPPPTPQLVTSSPSLKSTIYCNAKINPSQDILLLPIHPPPPPKKSFRHCFKFLPSSPAL